VDAPRAQQVRVNWGVLTMKGSSKPLTEAMIKQAGCPPERSWQPLWDKTQPGLVVRIYKTGTKSYWYAYRPPGGGRQASRQWVKLGDVASLKLKDARDAARIMAGQVAKGGDPAGERREAKRREKAYIAPALDAYERSLKERKVVKTSEVMSLLRRELQAPLGKMDLAEITRADLVKRIEAVKASGRPGTARELRTRAGVFLGWCVDQGMIQGNPLAGWRQPRRTRAERIESKGRALEDGELAGFWRAAEAQGWPFGPYIQLLLLLGQRRTETALMAWSDLLLDEADAVEVWPDHPPLVNVWRVPPEITKSGRPHFIPLPTQAAKILKGLPRLNKSDAVFPGRKAKPMTGWSKRLPDAYKATAQEGVAPWTPHDLRRTMRTGLGRLGVEPVIAELLLDHAISDDLARIYDRGAYWEKRVEASQAWADHVFQQLAKKPRPQRSDGNVVELREVRR
jgi:integrase